MEQNYRPFPFAPAKIAAVSLSRSQIDLAISASNVTLANVRLERSPGVALVTTIVC